MDLKVFRMLWGNDHHSAPFPIAGGVVGDVFLEEPHPLPRLHRGEQKAWASAPRRPWPISADCRVCCWDQAQGEECGDGRQDSTLSHWEATQWRLLLFSLSPPALGWETVSSVLLLKVQDCRREGRYGSLWIHTLFPSSRKSGCQKRKRQLNWGVLVVRTLTSVVVRALHRSNSQFSGGSLPCHAFLPSLGFVDKRYAQLASRLAPDVQSQPPEFKKPFHSLVPCLSRPFCFSCDFKTTSFNNPVDVLFHSVSALPSSWEQFWENHCQETGEEKLILMPLCSLAFILYFLFPSLEHCIVLKGDTYSISEN